MFIREERWLAEYESRWNSQFNKETVDLQIGYVSPAAVRSVDADWMALSWYPNTFDRFHEVTVFLPKNAFVACVDIWEYDERPTLFVKDFWINDLHLRPLAAFAWVDAIGVKDLLRNGGLSVHALQQPRGAIDTIAERHPQFGFVSFADSLLIKQGWSAGHFESGLSYSYTPEAFLPVAEETCSAIKATLGLDAYAVMTQGLNAYAEHETLHFSKSRNHVSLNTLGLPFAQLMEIESAARAAIREKVHAPANLYLDVTFFRSLKLRHDARRSVVEFPYRSPLMPTFTSKYVATSFAEIASQLNAPTS